MELDEAELVRRSQGGDLGAFNGIVERYQGLVFNLSARILGNRPSAEDVAQAIRPCPSVADVTGA